MGRTGPAPNAIAPAAPVVFRNARRVITHRLLRQTSSARSSRARHRRPHHALHHVLTDLIPHRRPDTSGEAVVEAGPDTRARNLVGKRGHAGPAVRYAG